MGVVLVVIAVVALWAVCFVQRGGMKKKTPAEKLLSSPDGAKDGLELQAGGEAEDLEDPQV